VRTCRGGWRGALAGSEQDGAGNVGRLIANVNAPIVEVLRERVLKGVGRDGLRTAPTTMSCSSDGERPG